MSSYRILTVCTGNLCRSPMMERLLVLRLGQRLGSASATRFVVESAGTWAVTGHPMEPDAAACLTALGADPGGFVARELTPGQVERADLVLTAERRHRAAAVTMSPSVSSRALTVRELARLLTPVRSVDITATNPAERMRAIVAAAAANRGLVPPDDPRDDDIVDPYRQPRSEFVRVAAAVDAALAVALDLLAPISSGQPAAPGPLDAPH